MRFCSKSKILHPLPQPAHDQENNNERHALIRRPTLPTLLFGSALIVISQVTEDKTTKVRILFPKFVGKNKC